MKICSRPNSGTVSRMQFKLLQNLYWLLSQVNVLFLIKNQFLIGSEPVESNFVGINSRSVHEVTQLRPKMQRIMLNKKISCIPEPKGLFL